MVYSASSADLCLSHTNYAIDFLLPIHAYFWTQIPETIKFCMSYLSSNISKALMDRTREAEVVLDECTIIALWYDIVIGKFI